MIFMRGFALVSCLFSCLEAQGKNRLPEVREVPIAEEPAPVGPLLLVEWNAADVLLGRARLRGEYMAMDGVSFGFSTEYQRRKEDNEWSQTMVGVGASVTQQYQSLSLRKTFLRGEASAFLALFEKREKDGVSEKVLDGSSVGMAFEAVGGYRWVFLRHLTMAPAIGVRRLVPDFFRSVPTKDAQMFSAYESVWQARLEVSVGVGF